MSGYWLNTQSGKCVQVETTHDDWVRDKKHAEDLGLSGKVYDEIMRYSPTAIDEIRLLALQGGLVRIREHPRYVSVQLMSEPQQVASILKAVVVALTTLKMHPDTTLKIDNFLLSDSVIIGMGELETRLANNLPPLKTEEYRTGSAP